jgi:flagella basal body P-ring formation protein FlgA
MNNRTPHIKRSNLNGLSAQLAAKILLLATLLTLIFGLIVSSANAATLNRSEILIQSNAIKLGDVFDNVGQHADFVLAPAPLPGQNLVWNTATLTRIATAFNLPWRPQQNDTVQIKRAATLVDADTLKVVLREYMASTTGAESYNITFTSEIPEIIVPSLEIPQIEVSDLSMPAKGGIFSAILKISSTADTRENITLRGMAERMVKIPTLSRSLQSGAIIQEKDIAWVTIRALSVNENIIQNTDDLIGSTPRKSIVSGNMIRSTDIEKPRIVNRGDAVTLVFNKNGMYLTTKGRAMQDGTIGDTITISNLSSNRQIEGRITANREVTVQ